MTKQEQAEIRKTFDEFEIETADPVEFACWAVDVIPALLSALGEAETLGDTNWEILVAIRNERDRYKEEKEIWDMFGGADGVQGMAKRIEELEKAVGNQNAV